MRERFGVLWPFISFFVVSLAQHAMLVGMTLPLAACMLDPAPAPLGIWDALAITCCCVGLVVGAVADTQLWEYMNRKDTSTDLVLKKGLWRYLPLTALQSMLRHCLTRMVKSNLTAFYLSLLQILTAPESFRRAAVV
jgi:hypothetical protein